MSNQSSTRSVPSPAPAHAPTAPPPPPQAVLMQMMSGAWVAQSLYTATRLGLADRLASGAQSSADLARATGVLPDRLKRLLRALASIEVFHCRADGRYENTPLSTVLAKNTPGSVSSMVLMCGEQQYVAWSRFHECLRVEKTAFELEYGEPIFDWYAKHPAEAKTFNEAMQVYSAGQIPSIVAAYDTSAYRSIVDVGGGHGQLLAGFLQRSPEAKGRVFDLEQGLAGARAAGLDKNPRVALVAGNFFESAPADGDLYVLKFILHDWNDAQCATILGHIQKNMARGGKVLVVEQLVAGPNQHDPAKWMDLHMMAMPGGRERTEAEFAALFAKSGLRLVRVIPTACGMWLLEAESAR